MGAGQSVLEIRQVRPPRRQVKAHFQKIKLSEKLRIMR